MIISFCALASPPRQRLTKCMTQAAHPISIPNFRVYIIGRLSAVLSQYAMMLVLGWQAYNIARESMSPSAAAAQLGFLGLDKFLPLFLLTPVMGCMAERFDRRSIASCQLALNID